MQRIELYNDMKRKFEQLGVKYKELDKKLDDLDSSSDEYKTLRAEQIKVYEQRRRLMNKCNELKAK